MILSTELWLSEVEMNLLSGDKDERNLLANSVDSTETTFTFSGPLEGIQAGAYLGIDLEQLYVVDAGSSSTTATVIRGQLGSIPTAHAAGAVVYVNPRFSRWQMLRALNAELRDMSAPPNMIFQVKDFQLTTQPVAMTYAVPAENTDIISLLELRYSYPDAYKAWPRVTRNTYSILRNMPTSDFASGMAIRLDENVYPGRTLQVRYAAPFTELDGLVTDVVAATGIPVTAVDIPPLGAAARLMGVREAKRSFTESEGDSRRSQEVPSGSAARAAGAILAVLNQRIRSEASRLKTQFPETV